MSDNKETYTAVAGTNDEEVEKKSFQQIISDPDFWNPKPIIYEIKDSLIKGFDNTKTYWYEVGYEFTQPVKEILKVDYVKSTYETAISYVHIPYFPAFHRPGWLIRYAVGPYNESWAESIFIDIWAGITVGLTLIPQGLSYAQLANLPQICGLYAAVLPSAVYTFFGSSMQLAVGPVAIVSLLTGQLVVKYVPNYATDTESAINCAAQVALAVGSVLTVLSVLNLGNFIRYISLPVMSGFTSGAACVIGLNQLKNAFGFSYSGVPQQGQPGYDYNYQVMRCKTKTGNKKYLQNRVYEGHFYRNKYAAAICFGVYFPLIVIQILKWGFKETEQRKKSVVFKVWSIFAALCPFIAIIIAAHEAWYIHHNDDYFHAFTKTSSHHYDAYSLKVVGKVTPGLHFLRSPKMEFPFGKILKDSIAVALIAYMESYSVSRRIAAKRGELHLLNASQELWANGVANLLASVSTAYPVCGSFSRSSLNDACGAKTPLSKVTTMIVIIVALKTLTGTFQYIPQAVLAAIIFAAIWGLISLSDVILAFKHNKKDFFTILLTWIIVLTFNTEIGLAVGLCVSGGWFVFDLIVTDKNKPKTVQSAKVNNGVEVLKVYTNITFFSIDTLRDYVIKLTNINPYTTQTNISYQDAILLKVSSVFDKITFFKEAHYVDERPLAVAIDLQHVEYIDLTGLQGLLELFENLHKIEVKLVLFNASEPVAAQLNKFGIENDVSTLNINVEEYLNLSTNINRVNQKVEEVVGVKVDYSNVKTVDENESKEKEIELSSI
eukprot:gene19955-25923_t